MTKMRKLFCLWMVSFALVACTERIDVELNSPDQQRLVVEGWITDQLKQHEVRLTLTGDYFSNQAAPTVSSAFVQISDGTETWTLTEQLPGKYYTPVLAGIAGKKYKLNISFDGKDYEAEALLRKVAPIDSMRIKFTDPLEEYGFDGDPWYDVLLWTQEYAGKGDSYMWLTSINGNSIRDTLRTRSFTDDNFIDGSPILGVSVDAIKVGDPAPDARREKDEAIPGDTIYIEQWNIGRDAYRVLLGIMNETAWNGGLFDAPPANVETNLSNGALGFFGAAGVSSASAIVPEP